MKDFLLSMRSYLFRFLGGLFMEEKEVHGQSVWVTSLGRIAFWAVFVHMMVLFGTGRALSDQEMNVFYALLGYQGVKVGGNALYDAAEVWKTAQPIPGKTLASLTELKQELPPPAAGPKD